MDRTNVTTMISPKRGGADAVISLLREPSRREAMGNAARELVCNQYDWRAIIPEVEAIYHS